MACDHSKESWDCAQHDAASQFCKFSIYNSILLRYCIWFHWYCCRVVAALHRIHITEYTLRILVLALDERCRAYWVRHRRHWSSCFTLWEALKKILKHSKNSNLVNEKWLLNVTQSHGSWWRSFRSYYPMYIALSDLSLAFRRSMIVNPCTRGLLWWNTSIDRYHIDLSFMVA